MSHTQLRRATHRDATNEDQFLALAHRIGATDVTITGIKKPLKGNVYDSLSLMCVARARTGSTVTWKPALPTAPHDPEQSIATTFEVFLTAANLRNELQAKEPHWNCSVGLFGGAMELRFQSAVARDAKNAGATPRKLLV